MESAKVIGLPTEPKLSPSTKILLLESKSAVLDSIVTGFNIEKQTQSLRDKFLQIVQEVLKEYPGYQFDLNFNLIKLEEKENDKTIPD